MDTQQILEGQRAKIEELEKQLQDKAGNMNSIYSELASSLTTAQKQLSKIKFPTKQSHDNKIKCDLIGKGVFLSFNTEQEAKYFYDTL